MRNFWDNWTPKCASFRFMLVYKGNKFDPVTPMQCIPGSLNIYRGSLVSLKPQPCNGNNKRLWNGNYSDGECKIKVAVQFCSSHVAIDSQYTVAFGRWLTRGLQHAVRACSTEMHARKDKTKRKHRDRQKLVANTYFTTWITTAEEHAVYARLY